MHHTVKGTRPDGLPLRRRRPGLVAVELRDGGLGIATAHEFHYHPNPLRAARSTVTTREFVKVGHALGGTDLPRPRRTPSTAYGSTCLLALTLRRLPWPPVEPRRGPGAAPGGEFIDWAIRDTLPPLGCGHGHAPSTQSRRTSRPAGRGVVGDQRHPLHDGPAAGVPGPAAGGRCG